MFPKQSAIEALTEIFGLDKVIHIVAHVFLIMPVFLYLAIRRLLTSIFSLWGNPRYVMVSSLDLKRFFI